MRPPADAKVFAPAPEKETVGLLGATAPVQDGAGGTSRLNLAVRDWTDGREGHCTGGRCCGAGCDGRAGRRGVLLDLVVNVVKGAERRFYAPERVKSGSNGHFFHVLSEIVS